MIVKVYLATVGLLYLGLAVWCSLDPIATSQAVGFQLSGPSGQSEFLTVYGGLEFGLGLIFLLPLVDRKAGRFSLLACLLVHACLVGFRTASFVLFDTPARMTYQLAAGEWVILLSSIALWLSTKRHQISTKQPVE